MAGTDPNSPSHGKACPRNPWLALALSACPGLGQHYAGFMKRGIAMYVSLILASWLAAIVFMMIKSKLSIVFLAVPFVGVGLIALDAYLCARRQPRNYRLQWFNRPWIYAGVFVTLLVTVNPVMDFIVGNHIVRAFFMGSSSMQPTILPRDIVLVNKMAFPKRGEIALINLGKEKQASKLTEIKDDQMIKRVIAGPGDTLEIKNSAVWVNSQQIAEPYANFNGAMSFTNQQNASFGPKALPAGAYFVMGDNRNESIDSRMIGLIEEERIGGTVTKVFWSWNFDEGGIRWDRTAKSLY